MKSVSPMRRRASTPQWQRSTPPLQVHRPHRTDTGESPMIETRTVNVGDIKIGGRAPFALITGPCQLESLEHARMMAEKISEACAPTGTKFIFKASYDKANRSSISTQRAWAWKRG